MEFTRVKQLRSWDRFILPLPFSQMTVRCREILTEDLPKDRTQALAEIQAAMIELNGTRQ